MKNIFFYLLTLTVPVISAIPQTSLLCDFRADTLVTDSSGWVTKWGDPIGYNDSLYQDTLRWRPKKITRNGKTCIRFANRATVVGVDTIWLNIPQACSLITNKMSLFVVCGNNRFNSQQSFVSFGTGSGSITYLGTSAYNGGSNLGASRSTFGTKIATKIFAKTGLQVLSIVSTNNATHFRDGYKKESQTPYSTLTRKGGAVGMEVYTSYRYFANAEIYRIIIYNDTLNIDSTYAVIADCINRYNITCTDSSLNNVLGVGSNMIYGVNSTDRFNPMVEINGKGMAVHNYGIPNAAIGTSALTGTWAYDFDTRILPIYRSDSTKSNIISLLLGGNDISAGQTGAQAFERLVNFIADLRDSMPSAQIWVSTLPDRVTYRTAISAFNDSIRTSAIFDADRLFDIGYGSPIETRFNDYTNTYIYSADGVNLTDSGYKIIGGYYNNIFKVNINSTIPNTTVSAGDTAFFNISAACSLTLSYQWYKDDATVGGNFAACTLTNMQASDSGDYVWVKITNVSGDTNSDSGQIIVNSCTPLSVVRDSIIGKVATTYTDTVKLSAGTADSITILSGTLPSGLTLTKSTGKLSGTVNAIYARDSVQFKAWGCANDSNWWVFSFAWDSIPPINVISTRTQTDTFYIGDTLEIRPSFPVVRIDSTIDTSKLNDLTFTCFYISDTLLKMIVPDSVSTGPCTLSVGDSIFTQYAYPYCAGTYAPDSFTVSLSEVGSGTGTTTKDPDQPKYHSGDSVTVAAIPGAHSSFQGWSGDTSTAADTLRFDVLKNWALTAEFWADSFGLAYTITGGNAAVTFLNDSIGEYSDEITCTLTVDTGYVANWPGGYVTTGKSVLTVLMTKDSTLAVTTYGIPLVDSIRPGPKANRNDSCTASGIRFSSAGVLRNATAGVNAVQKYWSDTQIDFYTDMTWPRGWNTLIFTTKDSLRDTGAVYITIPRKTN